MPCEIQWGMGNKPTGSVICTRGRTKTRPCSVCKAPGALLCDGPSAPRGKKTCDLPLCSRCATQIRALNKDFCPAHGPAVPPLEPFLCQLNGVSSISCGGAHVDEHGLCVRHAVVFDHWAGHHGGLDVYRDEKLNREQKRTHFRTWLLAEVAHAEAVLTRGT